jgi:hypothetical protein
MATRISACPNCGKKPIFVESDDPEFKVLLKHDDATCPNRLEVYHDTPREAVGKWQEHGATWPNQPKGAR